MDKKAVVHIQNGILLSYKKKCIWVSSNEVDETGAYYTKWNKSERERQILYINAYIWNLDGEGNGIPLQCSCLENSMDRGAWWAAVHGVAKSRHDWVTSLSLFTFMHWRRKWQPTPVFLPGDPGTGKPGGLPSMGSHRVGHYWSDLAAAIQNNQYTIVAYFGAAHPELQEVQHLILLILKYFSVAKSIF